MAKPKDNFILEDPTGELTDRQKLFCHEYITKKFNGTQAAIAAGYSENCAKEQASRLLTNANITKFIGILKEDLGFRLGISREKIAAEYAKVAFLDIADIFDDYGAMKPIKEMGADARGSIAGIEVVHLPSQDGENCGTLHKIKLHNKLGALDSLNYVLGYNLPTKTAQTNAAGQDVPPITQVQIVSPVPIDED